MLLGARVVVVVPAYDEGPRILRVVSTMPAFVDHVVVVDDASRDDTRERAKAALDPRVEVITHAENRGVGAAIATGYRRALTLTSSPRDAFAVMAGDGQMAPSDLAGVVGPVARGEADYVKGNRFLAPDVRRVMPWARRWGGAAFSHATSWATGLAVTDTQCGYTALARGACAKLDLDDLWPRYGYPNDLLGQLARRKLRVREVPVRPIYGDEKSGLRAWHAATITWLVARAWARRVTQQRSRVVRGSRGRELP